jgi:GNAT superfamily N-acetyltransferase
MEDIDVEPYTATKRDATKVIETLVEAFLNDSLMCAFLPEPKKRLRFLPRYFNYRIRNAFLDGNIYATSKKIEGVVILTESEYKKFSWMRAIRTGGIGLYRAAGSELVKKMLEVERYSSAKCDECVPEPHWYLGSLAVRPDFQGKGLASKLIRHVLEKCSSHSKLCVLETQYEHLVQMYEYFGFEVVDSFQLPIINLNHWIMAKKP